MIQSMTGFGATREQGGYGFVVEIKAVNHRFCEVRCRLPRELAPLELRIAEALRERLERGYVEVTVRVRDPERPLARPAVNRPLLDAWRAAYRELAAACGVAATGEFEWLSEREGIFSLEGDTADADAVWAEFQPALMSAADHLIAMRENEGAKLATDIRTRLAVIAAAVDQIRAVAPNVLPAARERLVRRIAALTEGIERAQAVDEARLAQEIALIADRADIEEELTRLGAHVTQFESLLKETAPVGRKLDFLTQELGRELNTIASKTPSIDVTRVAVEMKAEVERIREQVQNIR